MAFVHHTMLTAENLRGMPRKQLHTNEAFLAFALQRIRAAGLKGTCAITFPAPFLGLPLGVSTDVGPCP